MAIFLIILAEREGFEPSIDLLDLYSLSRGAPSTNSAISPNKGVKWLLELDSNQ
jgi:hypothetical protein